jgi:hypothetical protein
MDSILIKKFLDRINRIFRIFVPGFPDESLEIPIAFGDRLDYTKKL